MALVLGVEVEDLRVRDDATHVLFFVSLSWAPLDIGWLSFDDEAVERRVTLMVGDREHLVSRARHQVSIDTPFSVGDLLAVLGDARNLSLTLAVEESKTTFFSSNNEHWVRLRPADVRGGILVARQFDVLELALAHRPDGDHMRLRQDGERVAIFVPSKPVNSWLLVAWELKHWLSLSA